MRSTGVASDVAVAALSRYVEAMEDLRDGKLRVWGAHWRARAEGCPKEDLSREPLIVLEEGDNEKEIEAMKVLHRNLTPDEAAELRKYGPNRGAHPLSYELPDMAQLEREVSDACSRVGAAIWERYKHETEWAPGGRHRTVIRTESREDGLWGILEHENANVPLSDWQGLLFARIGVRFAVRQVYVCKAGTRSQWPGSSFDFLYPYVTEPGQRRGRNGVEAVIAAVLRELVKSGSR